LKDLSLTEQVKSFGREAGLDVIGICSVNSLPRLKNLDHQRKVQAILPEATSVVVGGVRIISSAIQSSRDNIRIAQYSTMCLYNEMERISYSLSRFLDDKGYRSAAVPTYLPIDMYNNLGLVGDISLRHAAVEAGLGSLGLSGLVLTPGYGPRIRFLAVLTDAPLVADSRRDEKLCDDCGICVDRCPVGAISRDGVVDVRKCANEHMKFGLPGLVRFCRSLVGADNEQLHAAFKSPEFWEHWQNLSNGMFYYCFECLNQCPIPR
jgi:epoxyqueuosine reductase QueG